ncbi:MAG TPA: hypothetical protein VNW54_02725, partial [Granulicella sp.]|nr:hypothetical protein [Granulicella sp.]
MWCVVALDNNGYGRFEFVMVAVALLSIADLLSGFLRLADPVLTANGALRQGLVGMSVMGALLGVFYPNCAENPVLQGGDVERGQRSCPQLGVCCCSMYWRMIEMGAPPQLP